MARPSRSKRKAARARDLRTATEAGEGSGAGAAIVAPTRQGQRRVQAKASGGRPRSPVRPNAQSGAPAGGVPVVVKVGIVAVLILLVLYLVSTTR